jgi:hypothetical protein
MVELERRPAARTESRRWAVAVAQFRVVPVARVAVRTVDALFVAQFPAASARAAADAHHCGRADRPAADADGKRPRTDRGRRPARRAGLVRSVDAEAGGRRCDRLVLDGVVQPRTDSGLALLPRLERGRATEDGRIGRPYRPGPRAFGPARADAARVARDGGLDSPRRLACSHSSGDALARPIPRCGRTHRRR